MMGVFVGKSRCSRTLTLLLCAVVRLRQCIDVRVPHWGGDSLHVRGADVSLWMAYIVQ